jgi:ribosomal protein S18 acetylase RimI-like enzyme
MSYAIRHVHPCDLSALYRICLLTGNSGSDASQLFKDPELIGHYYAAPYAFVEPELSFVLTFSGSPCGYIIGTQNSQNFYENCEKKWFPLLRQRYPLPDTNNESFDHKIIKLIHEGHKPNEDLKSYPAHLHIDLLPEAQGKGLGRKLIEVFNNKLRELKVSAVHLQVGKKNSGAIKFYEKVGFHQIKEYEHAIAFGMQLK